MQKTTITVPARKEPATAGLFPTLETLYRNWVAISNSHFIHLSRAKVGSNMSGGRPVSRDRQEAWIVQAGHGGDYDYACGVIWPSQTLLPPSPRRHSADYRWLYNGSQRAVCAYITRRPTRRSRGGFNGEIEVVGLLSRFVCFVLGGVRWKRVSGGSSLEVFVFFLFFFFDHILDLERGVKSDRSFGHFGDLMNFIFSF